MDNSPKNGLGQCTMDTDVAIPFTPDELAEIKKWAEVIGYQGTARDLERALALNRGIVGKCAAGLGERTDGNVADVAEMG